MKTLPASEFRVGITMTCGCTAQGSLSRNGGPALVGCGIHNCTEIVETAPDLTGRTATCSYGGNEVPSSTDLAFFRHQPGAKHDSYYCGCFGWD